MFKEPVIYTNSLNVGLNSDSLTIPGIIVNNVGTGDAIIRFSNGTTDAIIAMDNSSSDTLSIRNSATQVNSANGLNITTGNLVSIGAVADASAVLTLGSTTLGFLPPRMTSAQMQSIGSPSAGLIVYNNVSGGLYVYTSAGAWHMITTAAI